MKKISKGYYIVAAALMLWGMIDFYHYATIGKGLIAHYNGESIIQQLVSNKLAQGIAKAFVGFLTILIGWTRGNKKKLVRSLTAISITIGAVLFALWFLCMVCLTLGTAQYVFRDLTNAGIDYAEYAAKVGRLNEWFSADGEYAESRRTLPGAAEYGMNHAIANAGRSIQPPSYDGYPLEKEPFSMFRNKYLECDTAMVFLDKEGNILRESGDFIYFGYIPQEQWQAGVDATSANGWIDISDEADPRYSIFRSSYAGTKDLWDLDTIRITGYMDGTRIEPLAMAFLYRGGYYHALEAASPGWDASNAPSDVEMMVSEDGKTATVSTSDGNSTEPPYSARELDAMGFLEWDMRFDNTAQAGPLQEMVTIYARWPEMSIYEPAGPVRYQTTEKHENLLELLKTMGYYQDKGRNRFYTGASQFDLWNMIVFSSWGIYDLRDYDSTRGEPFPDAEYTIMTAMQASPLKIAMSFLRNVYFITFSVALSGFLLIRSRVRKHLLVPIQCINEGMAANWAHISVLNEKNPKWKEPFELWEHYRQTQDALRNNKNEISRLTTALHYAKTAEENRRQMTSNIAHELKTPLAVIHSYAEGLKEHIAEEKREKYLDVILSESERTDAMVLEMLDLSRLEAGKVKLSRDDFSLTELTKSVFEKLKLAAQAKELQISFDFRGECILTADESRIAQVVENFASNAVKYTPVGGTITVQISATRGKTSFIIENDCKPFSSEALNKVWDTFYRADEARSNDGTGLGLAIAKSIIELHGGSCSAHNTKTGVAFLFTL